MTPKPNKPATLELEGLGTRWIIELVDQRGHFPAELSKQIKDKVALFDDTYSRFKSDSLVGQLNAHGSLLHPPVELLEMFAFAHKMHKATHGAFDISVGATLQSAGYGQTIQTVHEVPSFWTETTYDSQRIVLPANAAIDFGGFGKGWLLDQLAVLLENAGHDHYLINGGGDIVVSAVSPLTLGLEHPYETGSVIGTTRLQRGALAVSSTVKRRWIHDGTTHHHIIDPATHRSSSNGVVSTYVRGETALIADTLATVLLLRPRLEPQLSKAFGVKTIILRADQLSTSIDL